MKIRRAFQSILPQPLIVIPAKPVLQLVSLLAALLGRSLAATDGASAELESHARVPFGVATCEPRSLRLAPWRETGPPRRA